MKLILIGDYREELLSTLEIILKNWGYRALVTSDDSEFLSILNELSPELIIAGPSILTKKSVVKELAKQQSTLLLIADATVKPVKNLTGENLVYPVDVFKLFELIQKNLEKIPRRNIRLNVLLPSMYYHGESPCIAEVISLSAEGVFIKTGSRIDGINEVRIALPLIGMQTEIEVNGRVVYRVEPHPDNNYLQGMGIEFTDIDPETALLLQQFVEGLLMAELSEKNFNQDSLNLEQLQNHSVELLLKMRPAS